MQLAKLMHALAAAALLATVGCTSGGAPIIPGGDPDLTPPSVPAGVTASKSAPNTVLVSWSASTDAGTGVAGYHLFRNGGGTPVATIAASQLTYTDSGLAADTDFSYTVTAYDGASPPNESAQSAASNIVHTDPSADTTAPSVPPNLTAVAQSSSAIALAWQASTDNAGGSGLGGYRVLRGGVQIQQLPAGTLAYTDIGLTASTLYSYTVRAYDNAGNESADSNTASATTNAGGGSDVTPPSVPTGVTASKAAPRAVLVSWSASTDAGTGVAGYHVFRNGGATPVATIAATQLNYTDSGLNANTDYSYTVSAFDGAAPPNESAPSAATAVVHTDADTTAPSVPQNLTAVAQSSSTIALAWQASSDDAGGSGLAGYRVRRGGTQIQQLPAGTLAYSDGGLSAGTLYSYTVRAYDNAGNESADSNTAMATTTAGAPPVGMTQRPSNTTCIAPVRPGGGGGTFSLAVQRVFPSLQFGNGNGVSGAFQAPGDNTRWFVTELDGHIRSFPNNNAATSASVTTFLDISGRTVFGGEQGLFGIAFHPNFPTDPRAFVSYTTKANGPLQSRISQFSSTDGGQTLDPTSEVVLVTVNQPAPNHNGGFIAFGPDGMLYFGLGDGGSEGDPWGTIGNGQNTQTLLAKMLRIDVSGTNGSVQYKIPPTNPFAGNAACNIDGSTSPSNCPEIYAWGLRNPWRGSFDKLTGKLWIGDVGQNAWEEVDQINLGGNYGWRCREGANPYLPASCGTAPPASLIDPVAQTPHTTGSGYYAVIGGYVYRGTSIPALFGQYVFADFLSGLYTVDSNTPPPTVTVSNLVKIGGLSISAFAQDQNGELLAVEYGGRLFQLISTTGGGTNTIPDSLSGTGCVNASNPTLPASGLIPYAPNAPFWSDGASKRRWLALPNGSQIDTSGTNGDWNFPNGTVLMKDFTLGGQLIETRLFMRHPDGVWAGYVYQWNAAQTDATRVINGVDIPVAGQTWHIPSESECLRCHTQAAGYSLGLETGQQNGGYAYPAAPSPPFTGLTANQLQTLNAIGLFTPAITNPATQPVIPNPQDTSVPLGQRARAWLHVNCSQCHRPGGGTTVYLDLRYTTAIGSTNTCSATPVDDLGITGAKVITPGNPAASVLYLRMNQRGTIDQMPPVASNLVDTNGAALLLQWINGMNASCQ